MQKFRSHSCNVPIPKRLTNLLYSSDPISLVFMTVNKLIMTHET